MMPVPIPQPRFTEALRFWVTLGFISFGGPAGQVAIMQHELVDRRRWIDQVTFLQALNFCMLLPGPEAQQLATYLGWKLHGLKGGLVAGIMFVLPGALLLYFLAWISAAHGETAFVGAAFAGLKPVVVALVLHALWRVGRKTLIDVKAVCLALAAFIAVAVWSVPFPIVVLAAGIVGWRTGRLQPEAPSDLAALPARLAGRAGCLRLLGLSLAYIGLLVVPVGALIAIAGTDPFLAIARFFTQAAFVTFGGAYAVLPYVAEAAVNGFHWLSPEQMMNGLALAETTPGPLILVLQYVGFFAGWNGHGALSPLGAATLGALVTTYATFLPSLFLILSGAPYVEHISRVAWASGALAAITSAVVGVIATLAMFFARQVVFSPGGAVDGVAIGAAIAAFAALFRFRRGLHWVVLAGALFGLARSGFGF